MAFDSKPAELQIADTADTVSAPFDAVTKPAKGWASANPDAAMAYLYVVQQDEDGLIQEILSA